MMFIKFEIVESNACENRQSAEMLTSGSGQSAEMLTSAFCCRRESAKLVQIMIFYENLKQNQLKKQNVHQH